MEILADHIKEAARRLQSYVHNTPVLSNNTINTIAEARLYFKCENFQKTGAFKIRGATNALLNLPESAKNAGVITHSSGNHGAALAQAAQWLGLKSYVVTPRNAPKVKQQALKSYGTDVTLCEPTLKDREATTFKIMQQKNAHLIHPYDNDFIITGQATAALELLSSRTEIDYIFAPVGGGGLLSGTALACRYFSPKTKVIGAEPELAKDAWLSLQKGACQPPLPPKTIADGLRTALCDRTFSIIQHNVKDIVLVSEQEIIQSLKLIWQRMKIVVEPSSAVALAAAIKTRKTLSGKNVGIIISGGNVDFGALAHIF